MVRIATESTYDDVPYEGGIVPGTHPDRLASVGRLFGLPAADPARCTLLEIGCASAMNLLPMAYSLPESHFVGIDPSKRQIEMGKSFVEEYGCKNVELYAAGVQEILDWDRKFDFIVCHGVFSWVQEEVQDAILEACRRLLAPNGVAYVSYNTLPGFYQRAGIREMLRFHASHFTTAQERAEQSRSLLAFLTDATGMLGSGLFGAYHNILKDEHELLRGMPDAYVIHEHLTEHNQAFYFHEFMDLAGEHDLQYLGDSAFHTMMLNDLPQEVAEQVTNIANSQLMLEQYRDFVVNRMFRKTLLVHKEANLVRQISVDVLATMEYRRRLSKTDEGEWIIPKTGGALVKVSDESVRSVLEALEQAAPRSLKFAELGADASTLAGAEIETEKLAGIVLSLYALDAIDVRAWTPVVATEVGEKPEVFLPARRLPRGRREFVPLAQHGFAKPTPFVGGIMHLADGTRTIPELIEAVAREIETGEYWAEDAIPEDVPAREDLDTMVPEALRELLQVGLLVAK